MTGSVGSCCFLGLCGTVQGDIVRERDRPLEVLAHTRLVLQEKVVIAADGPRRADQGGHHPRPSHCKVRAQRADTDTIRLVMVVARLL